MTTRRRRISIRIALLAGALLTVAGAAAPVSADGFGHDGSTPEDCEDAATNARVAQWAKDAAEPGVVSADEAARLDQQLRGSVTSAARDTDRGRSRRGLVTVPTWVHVISTDTTVAGGYVTDAQITAQLQVLNDSFAGTTDGAPTVFQFSLVGVTRTVNAEWAAMQPETEVELRAKAALHRGGPETLNIYVVQTPLLLGWAYLPDGEIENTPLDGVVVLDGSLPGGYAEPYNEGDTATHEVGHWLALLHTFENGCDRPGDGIVDTPYEAGPAFGCPLGRDSCPGSGVSSGADPVENFMDYSDDPCMHQFTGRQGVRMWGAWRRFRG